MIAQLSAASRDDCRNYQLIFNCSLSLTENKKKAEPGLFRENPRDKLNLFLSVVVTS